MSIQASHQAAARVASVPPSVLDASIPDIEREARAVTQSRTGVRITESAVAQIMVGTPSFSVGDWRWLGKKLTTETPDVWSAHSGPARRSRPAPGLSAIGLGRRGVSPDERECVRGYPVPVSSASTVGLPNPGTAREERHACNEE